MNKKQTINGAACRESGFTLIELVVVLALLSLFAALTTPNMMAELNQRRADLTVEDTTALLDATRAYRIDKGVWPGNATCSDAITKLVEEGYLYGVKTTNRYNNPITTSCAPANFGVVQKATDDWDDYLLNALAGTVKTNEATFEITTKIGVPGSEPALANKLSRNSTGNPEHNRMRTQLLMGGNAIGEAGDINFSKANPALKAQSGNLTLGAAGGEVQLENGNILVVDDIRVRSRGNRLLSRSMPNFVHIGTYLVTHAQFVLKPNCEAPAGSGAPSGTPKAALRPGAMRGGYTGQYDPAMVGRYGFNYRLVHAGGSWQVIAIAEGFDNDYANLHSLVDVYCYYPQ